ncbi:MAG: cadherin domain-containing protein [Planctomycetales bacterium]
MRTLLSATAFTPQAPLPMTTDYTENAGDAAIRTNSGIAGTTMPATDDGSTGQVSLGFSIEIGSSNYSSLYINNNGNVTFTTAMSTYTPFGISSATMALLAPFFADVDTRGTGTVTYGQTTVDGYNAFGVTWHNVGYFNRKTNKVNDFQLVIIDRSDIAAGDFDFEFNYDGIQWETGDFSGGSNGLGGTSARVGFAEGPANKLEFVGSGVNGALLDGGTNSLSAYNFSSIVDGRFRFQVRDGQILSPLTLDNSAVAENSPTGTLIGTFEPFDVNTSNIYSYSLVSGNGATDNASFTIVGDKIYSNTALDFESKSAYSIRVQGVNQHTVGFERILTINVTNVNETPTDVSLSSSSIAENSPIGTTVGTLSTTDPDASNTFTYSLVTGTGSTDNSFFSISGNQLQLAHTMDFETQSSYSIRVRTTDQGGLYYEKTLTISATNVNETPTNITLSSNSIAENSAVGTAIGNFSTTDPDASNTFTYTLVSGSGSTDNASFSISGNQLQVAGALDFDTKPTYSIRIRTTDQGGLYYEKTFTINATNVNETPTNIALSNNTVAEDILVGATVGTFTTTDPDASNTFTYTLVSGSGSTDNSYFTISGTQLQIAATLDYDTHPTYSIRIRTTDQGGLYFEKSFTINTTNVNETPTDISLSNSTIAENSAIGTTVGTFGTTDPDASNTFTYTLVSGTGSTDNSYFSISGNQLQIAALMDYDVQPTYSILVRSTDQGGLYFEKTFTITATNVNESPFNLLLSNGSVAEYSAIGTAVGTLSTWDPDAGDSFTYALVTGTGSDDNALFAIVGDELQTAAVLDYDARSSYSIRVQATDLNNLTYETVFTITTTPVNESPFNVLLSNNTVAETSAIGTTVGSLITWDPDYGDTFTYSLVSGTGSADNALFTIVGNELKTATVFDYDTRSVYSVRVQVTDSGNLTYEDTFYVNIVNVNEAPFAILLSYNSVAENAAVGTTVGSLSAWDPDFGDTFSYSLVSGTGSTDNASFAIVGNQLQTAAVFDYETKASYSIRIRATDAGNLTYDQVFTINVINVNDAPIALSEYSFNITDAVRASRVRKKLRDYVVVSVQDLIDGAGNLSPIPSSNPPSTGIAVIGGDNPNGTWQFSSDGGTTWQSLAGTSTASARLLGTDALICFVPTKKTFFGTVSLTAVAWNQLMGTSGTLADATTRGGLTSFSTNSFQINQTILRS